MTDGKTYIFPEACQGNNNNLAAMAMLNNGGFGNGMWNNPLTT